ncbi:hypothetical protein AB0B89_19705 [Sphaerisporangium sp. NPDC049002]|uniref:hypothetical protein n=1 Tax=unclassified Sphaerisporangium TaxID=2630420 RepID=UPI0033C58A02
MRFARTALMAAALGVAMLTVAGPAMADDRPHATPSPVPSKQAARPSPVPSRQAARPSAVPSRQVTRPSAVPVAGSRTEDPRQVVEIPRGAPETGGGPGANPLLPLGGALLAAGAGTGVLVLRRRAHDQA